MIYIKTTVKKIVLILTECPDIDPNFQTNFVNENDFYYETICYNFITTFYF